MQFSFVIIAASEEAAGIGNPESLVLESDFFLGHDFGENDYRIIGFERDSGKKKKNTDWVQIVVTVLYVLKAPSYFVVLKFYSFFHNLW